jgi:hypothetical protein
LIGGQRAASAHKGYSVIGERFSKVPLPVAYAAWVKMSPLSMPGVQNIDLFFKLWDNPTLEIK